MANRYCVALLGLSVLAAPATELAAESTAHAFIAAVEAFAADNPAEEAWTGPESPWQPTLTEPFADYLSDADRATWLARQRVGECHTVLTLEQSGFFNRHPELAAAFGSATVRAVFERAIVPQISHGYRRCVAFSRLIPIIEATKRRSFLQETYTVNLPSVSIWREPSMLASAEVVAYHGALRSLFTLAFCDRFGPAIADVIDLEKNVHTNQLDYRQLLWLKQLARQSGLETTELEQQLRYVRSMTPPHDIWLADGPYAEQRATGLPPTAPPRVAQLCQE